MTQIISRKDAIEKGLKRYFTGKSCKHGHIAGRLTYNSTCSVCQKAQHKQYYEKNKSCLAEYSKKWRKENRTKIVADRRKYRLANKERLNARARKWHADNKGRVAANKKKYAEENRGRLNAIRVKYQARKAQRAPSWADMEKIALFYRYCPEGCHVDHIIPLNGELVSGLHVETNLQWLPAKINQMKHNKYPVTASDYIGSQSCE